MPWVRAELRGQRVYARALADGALKVEGGRVEIRYKPMDGRRYDARADNLRVLDPSPLPDETCAPAADPQEGKAGRTASDAQGSGRSKSAPSTGAKRKRAPKAPRRAVSAPTEPPPGGAIAYADGACSHNPGPAGLGVVVLDGVQRIEISEYLGEGTNNIAELTAIQRALEATDPSQPFVVYTDSSYAIGVLQKGWRAKANVRLVEELKGLLSTRSSTRLAYVPGHSGVELNERADALARQAIKERQTERTVTPTAGELHAKVP